MHSARQSFCILLQLFKHQKAEGDGGGQLRQRSKALRPAARRFPVIGCHGEQRFQLFGGTVTVAGHFPFPNGAQNRHTRSAAPGFYKAFRRARPSSGTDVRHRAQRRSSVRPGAAPAEFLLCKGRKAVQQQVGPAGAHRLAEAGCHRILCRGQGLGRKAHRRLCDIKTRQLHPVAFFGKRLRDAAVVPALAAACIQQMQRRSLAAGRRPYSAHSSPSACPKMP